MQQAMHSMHNAVLYTPLLRHPSISQDQQAVVQLQQVSKELQAAVAELLAGQVPVHLAVQEEKLHQVASLAQWLRKHTGLLQTLDVHLCRTTYTDVRRAAAASQVAESVQQAAGAGLQLQSFCLTGAVVGAGILWHLPAAHLTCLSAQVDVCSSTSMQALAALSGLRCLRLNSSDTAAAPDDVLAPLTALQQLTQLHVGRVRPRQLQWVPSSVQQLQLSVGRLNARQLKQLADWLREHASTVTALELPLSPINSQAWFQARNNLVAAFQAAVVAATAGAAAATTPAAAAARGSATASSTWQLQELSVISFSDVYTAGRIVQHLPAGTLRQLHCSLNWATAGHISALCAHTGLRSLHFSAVPACVSVAAQADDVLAPLSALQQLACLSLHDVRRVQLQHLQMPVLQHLRVHLCRSTSEQPQPLSLHQLTALQTLRGVAPTNGLQLDDRLPPNLRQLSWSGWVTSSTAGIQPLLALNRLQRLEISCEDVSAGAAAAEEAALVAQDLVQLSTIESLQEVRLVVDKEAGLTADATAAMAWHALPLRALSLSSAGVIQAEVLQQLSALQGLTALSLRIDGFATGGVAATHQQIGLMLRQMTGLQHVTLQAVSVQHSACSGQRDDGAEAYHDVEGISCLLQAVCDLPALTRVHVELPVQLEGAAVQQLVSRFATSLPAIVVKFQVRADMVSMLS